MGQSPWRVTLESSEGIEILGPVVVTSRMINLQGRFVMSLVQLNRIIFVTNKHVACEPHRMGQHKGVNYET